MLDGLFKPKSIAVIGASANPLSIGHMVMKNLLDYGFKGRVYPVNPKADEILGYKAYPTVGDIPDPVDLVNISIKNTFVPMAIEDCGKKGVKFAIIHTAGFKEIGGEGVALEKQVLETAKKYGMRIYGPNSQGIENSDPDIRAYANFTFTPLSQGDISIVAQSGGVGEVLQLQLSKKGVGFRMYASYGNEADVGMNEILEYYGQDDGTKVIMVHIETLSDPVGFMKIASEITKRKPVLALKSGKTKEGLIAVSSHTGKLMEKDVTSDVIFKKSGIIRFDTQDEMIQAATALSTQPAPKGDRVALITNTGGPGILVVDEIISAGLKLAQLDQSKQDRLREKLFPEATVINPVDVLATATPEHYGIAIDALMNDQNVDSILISFVTPLFVDVPGVIEVMSEKARNASKPIVCVIMTLDREGTYISRIQQSGVPVFEYGEAGARALINMTRYGLIRHAPEPEYPKIDIDKSSAETILAKCASGYISQADAYSVLNAYGILTAKYVKVKNSDDLKSVSGTLKFPVVMKVDAKDIVHKSDEGGLVLNIADEPELFAVLKNMESKFKAHDPSFIVQEQLGDAVETIMGVNNTEGIGPIVMFGLGGIFVEALKDVQFRLAPLSRQDARAMIHDIKGVPILKGTRGRKGADLSSLDDILLRISKLATDFPQIAEMDLNPVFSFGPDKGSKVVDVRIKLQ